MTLVHLGLLNGGMNRRKMLLAMGVERWATFRLIVALLRRLLEMCPAILYAINVINRVIFEESVLNFGNLVKGRVVYFQVLATCRYASGIIT